MKKVIVLMLPVLLLALAGGAIACTGSTSPTQTPPTPTLDVSAIRAYADPATDTTLQGLSESNLAKYTQCSDAQFKAALTQDAFDKTVAQVNTQLGAYISKEFKSIEEQGGYTIVHYKVKYAKADVGVRMVFDSDHLVAGQWFE